MIQLPLPKIVRTLPVDIRPPLKSFDIVDDTKDDRGKLYMSTLTVDYRLLEFRTMALQKKRATEAFATAPPYGEFCSKIREPLSL